MKRFLIFLSVFCFLLSLFIVPAFAVDIPSYWNNELSQDISTVNSFDADFSFGIITDYHTTANLAHLSPSLLANIVDNTNVRQVLLLGDVLTRGVNNDYNQFVNEHTSVSSEFSDLSGYLLPIEGNHDAAFGYAAVGDTNLPYAHNASNPLMRTLYYYHQPLNVKYDPSGTNAYYYDDILNNVRYIMLNTHPIKGADNNQGYVERDYNSMYTYRFTQSQLDFLVDSLYSVPSNEYSVVVACHVPMNFSGEMPDAHIIIDVLNAYRLKNIYIGTYVGSIPSPDDASIMLDSLSANVDFRTSKGEFIAVFSGHIHRDATFVEDGITLVTTRCDAREENSSELFNERVAGTITEQSFDICSVDKDTRTIYMTKVGAGQDRQIQYMSSVVNNQYSINGKWQFNDTLDYSMISSDTNQEISFYVINSDGSTTLFNEMTAYPSNSRLYYTNSDFYNTVYKDGTWQVFDYDPRIVIFEGSTVVSEDFYNFITSNAIRIPDSEVTVSSILDIINGFADWLINTIGYVSGIFWDSSSGTFTVIGIFSIIALAIGVSYVVLRVLINFLRLK